MLQYLLNATAIWFISLLVFDVVLRRQSYHNYNRAYLLLTFVAGLVLPLLHWQHDTAHIIIAMQQPVARIAAAKQAIITTVPATDMRTMPWLYIAYLCGVAAMLCLLIIDIAKLINLYSGGSKQKENGWIIIETYKEHAPFSFLQMLFVSSRRLYNKDEWQMLLLHERQHSRLLHFADISLLQLAKMVLWFHPLVHLYKKRITMVHEYQADSAAEQQPRIYGRFLAEQCMLQAAPSVAHALSNSPLKDRILMLTHRSPRYLQLSKLLIFPLIALFMVCFTRYDINYQIESKNATYNRPQESYKSVITNYIEIAQSPPVQTAYIQSSQLPGTQYRPQAQVLTTADHYLPANTDMILLAGMENNPNAQCCSSRLLWGNDYSKITVTESYAKYAPVYLSAGSVNPCTQGFDKSRNERYAQAVERYAHVLDSWNEHTQINEPSLTEPLTDLSAALVVADDPWNLNNDKKTVAAPVLSIDRSIFGQSTRTIFDGATAMARPVKEKGGVLHIKNISFNP